MAVSDHVEAQLIDPNQDDNYSDANDGTQRLSRYVAGQATLIDLGLETSPFDMSTGANKEIFLDNFFIPFTGVLTADMDIYVPTNERGLFAMQQSCQGGFTVTVKRGAADGGVPLINGVRHLLKGNGTTVNMMGWNGAPLRFFYNGALPTNTIIFQQVFLRKTTLRFSMTDSFSWLDTKPAGGAVELLVDRNHINIGSIDFADGANMGTHSTLLVQDYEFARGDLLTIMTPANVFGAAELSGELNMYYQD